MPELKTAADVESWLNSLGNSEFANYLNDELFRGFITLLKDDLNLYERSAKALEEQIRTNNKIITSLKEIGDEISAEDYEKLSAAMKQYFVETINGTYALIASATVFKQQTEKLNRQNLIAALD